MEITTLRQHLAALTVYKNIIHLPVVKELYQLMFCAGEKIDVIKACSELCFAAASAGCINNIAKAVYNGILFDENPFSVASSKEKKTDDIDELVKNDIKTLTELSLVTPAFIANAYQIDSSLLPLWKTEGLVVEQTKLRDFYKSNGIGMFAKYKAFLWRKELIPIKAPDPVMLRDLKNYELQRNEVINNTAAFLRNLPANNILLYGDRGTGKSSTVHALMNEYFSTGLRIIEMPKKYIADFPLLISALEEYPLKFIIFIDDLSFSHGDDSFAALKAVLEGGLAAKPSNVLIYATSNRRHLVRESFSDRDGDEIHRGDTMEELLSLSDRFGITVTFLNPDRQGYYDIIDKMADDKELFIDRIELHERAERWALSKGGRSPRAAKQFIDILIAEQKMENN